MPFWNGIESYTGVYTKFSGRLSEEPFPGLIQKFPCIFIFKTGQPGCQLNLSEGQIRLERTTLSVEPCYNRQVNVVRLEDIIGMDQLLPVNYVI